MIFRRNPQPAVQSISKKMIWATRPLAKEDSLVNSSELRMAGQLFQGGEQKFVAK
jgi:hypothetical protein